MSQRHSIALHNKKINQLKMKAINNKLLFKNITFILLLFVIIGINVQCKTTHNYFINESIEVITLKMLIDNCPSMINKEIDYFDSINLSDKSHPSLSLAKSSYYFGRNTSWARYFKWYEDTVCKNVNPIGDSLQYSLTSFINEYDLKTNSRSNLKLAVYSRVLICNHYYVIGRLIYAEGDRKYMYLKMNKYDSNFNHIDSKTIRKIITD